MVLSQAEQYTQSHKACPCCHKNRRIKGYHNIQYRTLFGTVIIHSLRLYHCQCSDALTKTFSLLTAWLPEHISHELQYIETKWASYMSLTKTAALLKDVLPMNATHNDHTVRNHLHKVAQRQESELAEKPPCISSCANDWRAFQNLTNRLR